MNETENTADFAVVSEIISLLKDMDEEAQVHILTTVVTWLKINLATFGQRSLPAQADESEARRTRIDSEFSFTSPEEMTPKQFMLEKMPRTDVERVACLGYYLTHFRDTPQFKTIDLSKLNTEAAQRKFANAAETAKNAAKAQYFVPGSKKGHRQLSADAEQLIAALPDREAAAAIRKRMRPRRASKTSGNRNTEGARK